MTNSNSRPVENGSKHICGMFRDHLQQVEKVAGFLAEGLQKGEKVFLTAPHSVMTQINTLLEHQFGDFKPRIENRQIEFMEPHSFYLSGNSFSPERVFSQISSVYQQALADGFAGMRGGGVMSWALKA